MERNSEQSSPAPGSFAAQLDPPAWEALGRYGRRRTYPARAALFHQGDPSRHVLILLTGWVKVTAVSRGGNEALLALRGPGDILGELAAVDGGPRSATVTTLMPCRVQAVDGERFVEAVTQLPDLALALIRHLANSLRESDGKRLEYVSSTSSGRLAGLLLDLAARHGRHTAEGLVIELRLTQRELAAAAATSREAVARAVRTLRQRDVIRTDRGRVIITQPDVLRSLRPAMSDDT